MEIIALQEYTDKYVSLYEGQIRNLENNLAQKLIEKEIVAEHLDTDEGKSDNETNIFIVHFVPDNETTAIIADKTTDEISAAINEGKILIGMLSMVAPNNTYIAHDCGLIHFYTGTYTVNFQSYTYYTLNQTIWNAKDPTYN